MNLCGSQSKQLQLTTIGRVFDVVGESHWHVQEHAVDLAALCTLHYAPCSFIGSINGRT